MEVGGHNEGQIKSGRLREVMDREELSVSVFE